MQNQLHPWRLTLYWRSTLQQKKTKKGTSQNILLKSFLQHDSLGQGFVLQTEIKGFMQLITFHIWHSFSEFDLSLLPSQAIIVCGIYILLKLENS